MGCIGSHPALKQSATPRLLIGKRRRLAAAAGLLPTPLSPRHGRRRGRRPGLESFDDGVCRGEAVGGVLRHHRLDHAAELTAEMAGQFTNRGRLVREMPLHLFAAGAPREWHLAGDGEVERAAEGVDVGRGADVVGHPDLLGSDVVHRANHPPEPARFLLELRAGQTEIEHLDASIRHHEQVARLDVAVDEPLLMGIGEAAGRLRDHRGRQRLIERPVLEHLPLEVEPRDQFRDEIVDHRVVAGVVGPDEVLVVEPAEHPHLPAEGGLAFRRRLGPWKHLDRHLAAHHRVLGPKDLPHPAAGDLAEHGVLPEPEPPPAGQDFPGLKGGEQFLGHELVGDGLIPVRPAGRVWIEDAPEGGFGGRQLAFVDQAAGERRLPEAGWIAAGRLIGRNGRAGGEFFG